MDDQRAGAPTAGPLLVLGAVGVVFGDIGTSTLYAMTAVLKADTSGDASVARSGMPRWRQRIFLTLERLGPDPVDVLRLPRERAIVVGRELTW